MGKYHKQFCIAAMFSGNGEKQRKRRRQGPRVIDLMHQAVEGGLCFVDNERLENWTRGNGSFWKDLRGIRETS